MSAPSMKRLRASVRATALAWVLALTAASSLHAQQLDESLMDNTGDAAPRNWNWTSGEAGTWCVWIDFDLGTLEQFEDNTENHILRAATLGHPEWSNNTLTGTVNQMSSSGFSNAVGWQGWYVPNAIRIGASREVWKGISAGIQVGRAWSPAYIECTRADGETTVASWNQVRFADLVDQYVYYDDLYNGNSWQFSNNGTFTEGIAGWRMELVVQQELAHGLGWTASLGTTLGLNGELESRSAALFGGQGLTPNSELGPTLTPVSVVAAPHAASVGATYRIGAIVTGLSWSSVFVGGGNKNDWVAAGADAIAPLNQMRLRLGMSF